MSAHCNQQANLARNESFPPYTVRIALVVLSVLTSLSSCRTNGVSIELVAPNVADIVICEVFGQPIVHVNGNGVSGTPCQLQYPNEGVAALTDPTKKVLLTRWLTFKLVGLTSASVRLNFPTKHLSDPVWFDQIGGLTNCVSARPKISTSSAPDSKSGNIDLLQLRLAICNVTLDPLAAHRDAVDNVVLEDETGFAVPIGGYVRIALYRPTAGECAAMTTSCTFYNPAAYTLLSAIQPGWQPTAPPLAASLSAALPDIITNIDVYPITNASSLVSDIQSTSLDQNELLAPLAGATQQVAVKLTLGRKADPAASHALLLPTYLAVKILRVEPNAGGGSSQTCTVVAHGIWRTNELVYGTSAGSPAPDATALASRLIENAGSTTDDFPLFSLRDSAGAPLGSGKISMYLPVHKASAATNAANWTNLAAPDTSTRLDVQHDKVYVFSVSFFDDLKGANWRLSTHFAIPVGNPTVTAKCVQIVHDNSQIEFGNHEIGAEDATAEYAKIGHWGEDQGLGLSGFKRDTNNTLIVRNSANDSDNFVGLDPDRFYVEIIDYSNIQTAMLTAGLGTIHGDVAGGLLGKNGSPVSEDQLDKSDYYDTLTETPVYAQRDQPQYAADGNDVPGTGQLTAHFVSRSQLLTAPDFEDLRNADGTVNNFQAGAISDDDLPVNEGSTSNSGAVPDDTRGDRTHKADVDAWVHVIYPFSDTEIPSAHGSVFSGLTLVSTKMPVCKRSSNPREDERRQLSIKTYVLQEPNEIIKTTLPGGQTGYSKGASFRDLSGMHDGNWSYISNGFPPFSTKGTDGSNPLDSPGGVVSNEFVAAEIARAEMTWAPACIRIVPVNMNPIVVDTEPDTPPANSVGAPTTTPPNDVIFKDGLYFNNAGPKRRVSDRLKYIAAVEGGQPQGLRGEYALLQLLRKLPLSSKYDPVDGHILTVIYVPPIYLPVDVEVLGVAGYAEAPFSWAQDASALGGMSSIESVGQAAVVFVGPGGDYGAPKNRVLSHEIGHVLTNSGHEQKEATLIVYPASGADNDDLLTSGRRRIPGQTAVTATKCRVAGYAGEAAEMVWTESGNIILTFSGTNSDCRPTSH